MRLKVEKANGSQNKKKEIFAINTLNILMTYIIVI